MFKFYSQKCKSKPQQGITSPVLKGYHQKANGTKHVNVNKTKIAKKKEPLCSVGNVNQCSHCGYFMDNFSQLHKKSKTELSYDPAILLLGIYTRSDQIRSVTQLCPTLCDPMNHSTPGLPVYHQFPDFTQTHVHRVSDAI